MWGEQDWVPSFDAEIKVLGLWGVAYKGGFEGLEGEGEGVVVDD